MSRLPRVVKVLYLGLILPEMTLTLLDNLTPPPAGDSTRLIAASKKSVQLFSRSRMDIKGPKVTATT